jgi:thiol-disulfide isomerase/thioredoxin
MKSTSLLLPLFIFIFVFALSFQMVLADPAFTLPGIDGKEYAPLAAGGKKGAVVFFISPYCPTSNTFVKEMNQIAADYGDRFVISFVHSDAEQKLADILQHTEMNEIKAQVLMDKEQRLAKQTHAKITPEAVVVGPDGATLYQGRINDLYLGPTKRQRQATTKDLRDALEAVLAGKPVAMPKTEAMGCKISGLK